MTVNRGRTLPTRRRRLAFGAITIVVAALALAGCGSDDASSADGKPTASNTLTGDPIKVMTIASGTGQLDPHPEILAAAKLYGDWINSEGGIGGRPLEVITCDNADDPNKDAACARQAVEENVVATVGSYTLTGDSVVPVLEEADTAWFGICCAIVASELTSPIVQQLGSGLAIQSALAVKAATDGCENIVWIGSDAGATTDFQVALAESGLKSVDHAPLKDVVRIPIKAQDYSAQVAQALDGSDCLLTPITTAGLAPFFSAYASQGGDQRVYGLHGLLNQNIVDQFPDQTEGAVVVSFYDSLSAPSFDNFRSAIDEFDGDPGDGVFDSLGGLGTWAAFEEFKNVVDGISGTLDHETFLKAAQTHVTSFPGVAPGIDFSKKYDGLGGTFPNQVNRSVSFNVVKDGKIVPLVDGFFDMTAALEGTPLSAEDTPTNN